MAAKRVFVVVRRWWFFNDEYTTSGDDGILKAFNDPGRAAAYCRQCEAEERANDNGEDPSGHYFNVVELDLDS
jgi:hypothetical protein